MQNYNDKNTGKLQKKRKEKAKLETIQYQVSKDTKEEKSLHVEENIWEKIIHSVSDWIFLTDLDGRIIKTNEAGEKFTGFSCEEITGQLCCKLLHNSTKHVPDCPMQEMKRTGQKASSEILLPDGKWIQVTVDPVKNNDNKIESSIHIVRYITERKQTEEKLRSNEAQLSNAAKIAQIGYLEYDVADHLFIFNDQFYSIFRTTAEQVGGYTMTPERYAEMFIHPDDRLVVENEMKNIREISDTNFNRQLEHRILYADGGIGTISVRYFVIKNIQGRTLKIYGAIQDITERRQIKQELKKEQNLLRLLIDNIPDRIYIKDKEHRFILGNNAMIYYHGFQSEDEFIGKTDFDIYQEKYTKIFYSEEEDVIKNGKSIINERLSYKNKKGTEEWVLITKLPLRDMNGDIVGLVGITRDITEKKKTEYALRESEKKYRLLFESMMDGFALHEIVFDENNNPVDYLFIDINPAFEKLTGLKRDEIINKKASEVMPGIENDPGNWINKYVQVALTEQKFRFEEYSEALDRWYSVLAYCTNKNRFATIFEDITERKKFEHALQTSESQLSNAMKIARLGYWEYNVLNDVFTFNDQFYSIYGTSVEQVGGYEMSSLDYANLFVHPDDRHLVAENIKKVMETTDPDFHYHIEHRVFFADGSIGYIAVRSFIIKNEQERTIRVYGANQDITEQKKAEIELKESEEKYRLLVETLNEGIWKIDAQGYTTFVNSKMAEILGYSVDEMLGKHLFSFMEEKWVETAKEKMKERGNGIKAQHEFIFQKKTGEQVNMLINTSPIYDSQGNYAGSLAGISDITKYTKAMEQIKISEENYRELFENMPSGVAVYEVIDGGKDFIFKDFNQAAEKFDKISRKELIGKSIFEVFTGVEDFGLINAFRKAIKSESFVYHPTTLYKDDRLTAWYDNYIYTLPSGELVAVFDDVTEKKLAEQALRENERLLNEVGKIATIGGWEMNLITRKAKWTKGTYDIVEINYGEPAPGPDEHLDYYLHEYRPKVENAIKELIEKDIPLDFEAKAKTAKGNIRWFRAIGRAIRENGVCTKVFGTLQDITKQKEAELLIQRNLNALKQAEEIALLGIFERNWQTGNGYWSDGFYRLLDLEPQQKEYSHEMFMEFIHPDDRQRVEKHIQKMISLRKSMNIEFRLISSSGIVKHIHGIALNVYDVNGKPLKTIGTFQDITKNKISEVALNNHRRLLEKQMYLSKTLLDAIPCVAMLIKPKTREIVASNKAAMKVGAIPGKTCYGTWAQRAVPCTWCKAPKLWETGKEQHIEVEYMGTIWEAYWIHVSDDLYMHYAFDITERKKIEASILKYQEQLKSLASQLTLTEEKERYRIATHLHDQIGQYLAVSRIKLVELLNSDTSKEIHSTLKLIDEWLSYAIKEARSLTYDLSSPILHELGIEKAIAAWLDDEIRKKYNIETEFYCDKLQISLEDDIQVLLFRNVRELLFNVVKHAHAGKVKVAIETKDNNIQIIVEDDGVGFNTAEIAETATGKAQFGLFSIRERLEHFGGNMKIETATNKGCRIILTAPLKKD